MPVDEPASGRSSAVHLPVADQRQPLVQDEDLVNLLHFEHRVLAQIKTMVYDRLSERIISPLLALKYGGDKGQHVLVNNVFFLHSVDILNT